MLKNILQELSAETGISLTVPLERAMLISRINRAAKELYETKNLFGSIFESVFDIGVECNQISLPWYVKTVLGMRYYDGRMAIEFEDIVNRYFQSLNTEIWYLKFRTQEKNSLAREISNQSQLIFSIPVVESEDINITVIGTTDAASERKEIVNIPAGSLLGNTIGLYKDPVKTIRKDRVTTNDITIKDIEDNELGVIPNHLERSEYNIIQILDSTSPPSNSNMDGIEVIYERPFSPFVNDEDEFVFGDTYDDAIIWKYLEHRSKTPEQALAYQIKIKQLIANIWQKAKMGVKQKLSFKRGPYFNMKYAGDCSYFRYPNI